MLNGSLVYRNNPQWILITMYFLECSSKGSSWYTYLESSFEKYFPLLSFQTIPLLWG